MTENQGPPKSPDSEFDLDALIRADEEDKRKEDALLSSEKKKEGNRKKLFVSVLSLALVAILSTLLIVDPFHIIGDDGKKTDGKVSANASTAPTNPNGQGPGAEEKAFWQEKGKTYPVKVEDWQLSSATKTASPVDENGKSAEEIAKAKAKAEEERAKAQAALNNQVAAYNMAVPGVVSNLQTLPSRSNGFTDDPAQAVLPDGSLNPKYSYWTLEGFNENVNFTLQRMINPIFGSWQVYQYSSSKEAINRPMQIVSLFQLSYDPEYIKKMADQPASTWLPVYADWNGNDYGMGDQLLPEPGPRWLGSLENIETTFKFDETTQTYSAHVKAKVNYSAWSQSQQVLKKTGTITFDVNPGKDSNSIRYMLSNSKLEMTA